MPTKLVDRRTLVRTLVLGIGTAAFGRVIAACSDAPVGVGGPKKATPDTPIPTDDDEHVPGASTPVDTGDEAAKVPNPLFEGRVKQLEAEQKRLFARGAFLRGDAGPMTGKENSHEPKATVVVDAGKKRVEVVVNHVMGTNTLDAGTPLDAGAALDAGGDASKSDAAATDAGRTDAGDAGTASAPVVHYITTIYLRALVNGVDTVVALWEFASTDAAPPTVRFALPPGVTSVTAYEWCTIHGLWRSSALAT